MKVEIGSVKIKVNKKTISLNLKETQLLFDELNKIFGPKYNYIPWTGTAMTGSGTDITLPSYNDNTLNIDLTNK